MAMSKYTKSIPSLYQLLRSLTNFGFSYSCNGRCGVGCTGTALGNV